MDQGEGARDGPDPVVRVLFGRSRAVSIRAVAFAVALFIVVALFAYATMAASENVVYFDVPRGSFDSPLWLGFERAFRHPGLVVGLAALHAYLNEGYLPAVLLASAPFLGMNIWIYHGPYPGPYVLILKPLVGSWGWLPYVIRVVFPWATLGFLVGVVVRWLRTRVVDLSEPI